LEVAEETLREEELEQTENLAATLDNNDEEAQDTTEGDGAKQPTPDPVQRPSLAPSSGQQENLGRRWYVVHTYSGYENKVKRALERRIESMDMRDKIYRVVVPTMEETEIKNGQRHTVQRKVYPGYVLVEMMMTDESWYVVRNTQGVTSFVGSGNKPTPLGEDEMQGIIKQMEAEAPKVKTSFQVGQAVKIIDGPFSEFTGTIDSIDSTKNKVIVLVSIFGRETPLTLDFLQVERII
jgi:transcriptional antiterminator NusG